MQTVRVNQQILTADGKAIVDPVEDLIDGDGVFVPGDSVEIEFSDGKWFGTGTVGTFHADDFGVLMEVDVDWDNVAAIVVAE